MTVHRPSARDSITAHPRRRAAIAAAITIGPAVCWLALRGLDSTNLGPVATLWLGVLAGLGFATTGHRPLLFASSLLLCLGLVESGALAYEATLKPPTKKYSYMGNPAVGWFAEHRLVGYAFRGPVTLKAAATIGHEVLYASVIYQIDKFARRPCSRVCGASRHALFFGGSFAFGEGLSNSQTLSCRFQEASEHEFECYNYAMMGWGPGQAYMQLGVDLLFSDIQQDSGIAVFSFVGDHIYRTTWKIDAAYAFPEYPFFSLTEEGDLDGPFKTRERWRLRLARSLFGFMKNASPAFRTLVQPSWFRIESDEDAVITTAKVLGAAREVYRSRFEGEFVVLLWPRSGLSPALEDLFVDELTRLEVPVARVPALPGDPKAALLHPKDGHPSSLEIDWIAQSLLGNVHSMRYR
ncbi:MAG: hypothetical protein K8R59_00300 [Thermoanaerobaculales bacterium]|nr:hypothetical protein [Thermoanaerobaculales bacterium]